MTDFFPNRELTSDPLLDRLRASTVGLYDVAGEIGRGGMAVVYIARDLRLGRKVAIKVMDPHLNVTPGMTERFLQEARIAAQLQHHNIIVVHEVRHDEALIFFVMRVVEGGSLDEVCRRLIQQGRRLPIDQAQWILWQAARALAYAHAEGIIHRDVKPANILVSTKGEVVVTDFGIAKAVDGEGLTKTGMAIGTPTYMSPEQFVGQDPVSGASDQYALGVAAYEMLTGAPPFQGDLYRIIAAHGSQAVPELREKRPDCPEPLAAAVMRMLAKAPADRWPSLDAVLPVLGQGLAIDGSSTRAGLAAVATEMQAARAASVSAWGAVTPVTPGWSAGSGRQSTPSRPVPASITISPPNAQVTAGAELPLRAVVTSDAGVTIADAVVLWTSSNPSAATVSSEGVVRGIACGVATIAAEVAVDDGATPAVKAMAELRVAERDVARVEIPAGDVAIAEGEAERLTAIALDGNGQALATAAVQWASSRPDIVHVDANGTLLALAAGQATVSARVGGVQSSVRVSVRADARDTRVPDRATRDKAGARVMVGAVLVLVLGALVWFTRGPARGLTTSSAAAEMGPRARENADSLSALARIPAATLPAGLDSVASRLSNTPSKNGSDQNGNSGDSTALVTTRAVAARRRASAPVAPSAGVPTASSAAGSDSAAEPAPAPSRAAEAVGPNEGDMRRLSHDFVLRLDRGEFRTGSLESFFSGATSGHRVEQLGEARLARREGEARNGDVLQADVDLQLERTLGSGAVQRRRVTVRLTLRGRAGSAVIESVAPGALTNGR